MNQERVQSDLTSRILIDMADDESWRRALPLGLLNANTPETTLPLRHGLRVIG